MLCFKNTFYCYQVGTFNKGLIIRATIWALLLPSLSCRNWGLERLHNFSIVRFRPTSNFCEARAKTQVRPLSFSFIYIVQAIYPHKELKTTQAACPSFIHTYHAAKGCLSSGLKVHAVPFTLRRIHWERRSLQTLEKNHGNLSGNPDPGYLEHGLQRRVGTCPRHVDFFSHGKQCDQREAGCGLLQHKA